MDGGGGPSFRDELEAVSTVLLLASVLDPRSDEACTELLTFDDPADERVLLVTLTRSADERLDGWRDGAGGVWPAELVVVEVGGFATGGASSPPNGAVSIERLSNPSNVSVLGNTIAARLAAWQPTAERSAVCFHSLTPLLLYADLPGLREFLHVLNGQVATLDAVAHYHMDPGAHDDATLTQLEPLFEAAVRLDGDGVWTVSRH